MSKKGFSRSKKANQRSAISELDASIELVLRLAKEDGRPPEPCTSCLTGEEWSRFLGMSRERTRHFIRSLLEKGYMRKGEKLLISIDGRRMPIVCFELSEKATKEFRHAATQQDPR